MDPEDVVSRFARLYEEKNEYILEKNLIAYEDRPILPLREAIRTRKQDDSTGLLIQGLQIGDGRFQFTKRDDLPGISDLSIENLVELPVSLLIDLQSSVSGDARVYWEHTYSTFDRAIHLGRRTAPLELDIWLEVKYLFDLALCDMEVSGYSHAENVLGNSENIAAYLSYPILEGLLKNLLSCVDQNGCVIDSNTIERVSQGGGYYDAGDECHNLTDLLCHYEFNYAPGLVCEALSEFRSNLSEFDKENGEDEAYGIITDWRGSAMHGELVTDVQYGILINLICMILWGEVIQN
ncbi:hypothetical protein [Halobaculum sp. P14]|uniref:hypothetical protein n=1 Tax=Halobaculum sp. P14 TaxID=3421638 RepID=UPI003EBEE630